MEYSTSFRTGAVRKNLLHKPGLVVHAYNPRTWEAEVGG